MHACTYPCPPTFLIIQICDDFTLLREKFKTDLPEDFFQECNRAGAGVQLILTRDKKYSNKIVILKHGFT